MAKKSRQMAFSASPKHEEMITDIMEEKGYLSVSSVVQQAIVEMHARTFKDYIVSRKRDGDEEETKEERQRLKQVKLCQSMGGNIQGNGCIYKVFQGDEIYERQLPLHMLTREIADTQFSPSKAEVERLLGKTFVEGEVW